MQWSAFILLVCLQAAPVDNERDYQDQLDRLAHALVKRLETPASGSYFQDLELVASWPREEFRKPLMDMLGGSSSYAIPIAASALLNYHDPELRALVESYQADERTYGGGCIISTVGWEIRGVLSRHTAFVEFKAEAGKLGDSQWWPTLPKSTVQRAVAALVDNDLNVRLQAFCWLWRLGIVLDTSALTEAWPRLSNAGRRAVLTLGWHDLSLGESLARRALEQVLKTRKAAGVNDEVLGFLLQILGDLGSAEARRVAEGFIKKAASVAEPDDDDALRRVFISLVATSTEEDLEKALAWSRSPRQLRRLAGYAILARSDDLRAVQAVESFLQNGELPQRHIALGPWDELMYRPWHDGRIKWRYIKTLTALALERSAAAPAKLWPEGSHVIDIITTLGCIAQVENGSAGFLNPGGFNPETALETARTWAKWCEANDPYAAKPGGG